MDAHKITIKGIFNGSRKLEIPFYQRAYVWQEEQWERFLEDFELITSTKKPYFIGSIILKQGKVNTWDSVSDVKIVVDGQQRLTTLLLFFKAYCLKAGLEDKFERDFVLENDDIALSTGINDAAAFEEVMQHSKNEPIEESNSLTNIIDAFNYFLNNIDINKIDRLIILQNLEFVCIDIDEGEAFSTFEYKKAIDKVSVDDDILALIKHPKHRNYFKNLMYRLVLNEGSHRNNQTRNMQLDFLSVISEPEKRRTAKDILCFMELLNAPHVKAHLGEECAAVINGWCEEMLVTEK